MRQTKKIFREFIEERREYTGPLSLDKMYLSIAYDLVKRGLPGEIKDTYDLSILYDNLVINDEIISHDNYKEYDLHQILLKTMKFKQSFKTVLHNLINNKSIYLLNYEVISNYCDRKECFIKYDPNFSYFDDNFNFIK